MIVVSVFAFFSLADGTTDDAYLKFTTPKQGSLILGSSIAAQGIHPKELNAVLKRDDIYISNATFHYDGGGCC